MRLMNEREKRIKTDGEKTQVRTAQPELQTLNALLT